MNKRYSQNVDGRQPPGFFLEITALLLMALPPLSYASEVVIVPSGKVAPYIEAQNALKEHLASYGYTSKVVTLREVRGKLVSVISEDTKIFVAVGTEAAKWLHKVIKPPLKLTFCMVADPANIGLYGDRPVLGISTDIPLHLQFETMAEALPKTCSVGLLYRAGTDKNSKNSDDSEKTKIDKSERFLKTIKANLPKGWRIEAVAIDKYKLRSQAIQELFKRDIDIVWVYPDRSVYSLTTIRTLLLTAIREKKPVFGYSQGVVKAGSLLGVVIEPEKQGQQAAEFVNHLLSNEGSLRTKKPEPPQFEIAVNLAVAEQIKVDISPSFLKRAKYIFKPE
jgi:ABC-type uncharacterized transport system substrate-binding protein